MRAQLKSNSLRCALLAVSLALSACAGAGGSCLLNATAADGYVICEDYSGSEFNQSVGENNCNSAGGVYSADACATADALGVCTVSVNAAQEYIYTYLSSGSGSASQAALESACGVEGGTYSASR